MGEDLLHKIASFENKKPLKRGFLLLISYSENPLTSVIDL